VKKQFSIIIPTHNGASHGLDVALHSITSQCYDRDKYEIIVICDKCSDNTAEVSREFADKVVEVNHGNAGLTRNEGLERAEGEWILFMDDDDQWIGKYVLQTLDRYAKMDDFDVLAFGFVFGHLGVRFPFDNRGFLFPNVWTKMWKREFIGDTRFRNVYPNDDEMFCVDMGKKKPRFRISECILYDYNYMRPGSIQDVERKKNADKSRETV